MPGYRSRVEVYINGSLRRSYQASALHGLTVGIATATVQVDRDGGSVSPGDALQIKMGLNSSINWVFNGTIQDRGIAYYPTYYELSAAGQLRKSRRKSNVSNPACVPAPDPDLPTPDPVAYCAMDKTDGEIVTDLLALIGITNVDIEDSGLTLGTINPVQLPTGGSPWSLIQEIDKLTWMRTYDAPDGTVIRRPFTILPSAGASMTLTEGVDIFDGKPVQSLSGMITNAYARGASYIGADDTPINIEFRTDNPDENEFGVSDVEEFASDLIETFDVAEAWAIKTLGELGKLQERIEFTLARGHNEIRAGMTVAISAPTFGYGGGSRFLVEQVRHYADGVEYLTAVTFRGSAVPEGVSADKAPIALFVYKIHHEDTDDGPLDAVYVDGSASYDEDGVIALWAWTGSPVDPTPINETGKAVAIYEGGLVGGETITLTVTDNEGRTGTKTLPIVVDAGHPAEVRDLWIAAKTVLKLCTDGDNWQDIAIAAVGVAREANDTYNLAWTSGGAFHRVLVDLSHALLSPTGITAAAITYDGTGVFTGEAYAGSSAGVIYRSSDHGVTWATQGTIPGGLLVTQVSAILGTPGGVQALAGDTLWESFDQGGSWVVRKAYGNVANTATDFAAGFGHGFIGFAGPGTGADFVQERDSAVTLAFPAPDLPIQVRALTLAGDEPVLYVLGVESGGDGVSYIGDAELGGEMTQGAWDTTRDGTPNDGFRDSLTDGLVYVAADDALVKTMDGFLSTYPILAAVGSEQFLKIGVGKLHAALARLTFVSTVGDPILGLWNGSSVDSPPANWATLAYDDGAWAASVAANATGQSATVTPDSAPIWTIGIPTMPFHADEALVRHVITLPTGTIKTARLRASFDAFGDVYLNGTLVGSEATGVSGPIIDIAIDPTTLVPGGKNVIAAHGKDVSHIGSPSIHRWITFRLDINGGTS